MIDFSRFNMSAVDNAAKAAATHPDNDLPEPTQAQKESGLYKKGHVKLAGMNIAIENPAGSTRSGTDKYGVPWIQKMNHHYGYIKGTVGKDKDHLDVFIKPGATDETVAECPVYVIDQVYDGKFDEHKIMLGFMTAPEATAAYLSNYEPGWRGLGCMTSLSLTEFLEWVKDPSKTKCPMEHAEHISAMENFTMGNPIPVDDVTQEVGEDGQPVDPAPIQDPNVEGEVAAIPPEELESSDMELYQALNLSDLTEECGAICPLDVHILAKQKACISYCPMTISKSSTGSLLVKAYISGKIQDVDYYVDLLDLLNTAVEGDTIIIYLDSPGGYVVTGATIASCIAMSQAKVITVARGYCASAASLIWSAGHICWVTPTAVLMWHMSMHRDEGNSVDIRDRATDGVRYVTEALLAPSVARGFLTQEELNGIIHSKKEVHISGLEMQQRLAQAA